MSLQSAGLQNASVGKSFVPSGCPLTEGQHKPHMVPGLRSANPWSLRTAQLPRCPFAVFSFFSALGPLLF